MKIRITSEKVVRELKVIELQKFTIVPAWIFWNIPCCHCHWKISEGKDQICTVAIAQGETYVFHHECFEKCEQLAESS